ncbi:MAG: hypothetical protein WCE75_12980, partial [Terracidiphilus sp.]
QLEQLELRLEELETASAAAEAASEPHQRVQLQQKASPGGVREAIARSQGVPNSAGRGAIRPTQ